MHSLTVVLLRVCRAPETGRRNPLFVWSAGRRECSARRRQVLPSARPPNVPAKQFWAVTAYDLETVSPRIFQNRSQLLSRAAERCRRIGRHALSLTVATACPPSRTEALYRWGCLSGARVRRPVPDGARRVHPAFSLRPHSLRWLRGSVDHDPGPARRILFS